MPAIGGGTVLDKLPKKKRTASTKTIAEAEGDKELVLVRARIEMADDQSLHQHANQHHKQRTCDQATMNDPEWV